MLDKIRFEIDKNDDEGELFEFYWFAREYPRFYRYHLDHAEHRLKEIHKKYQYIKNSESGHVKDWNKNRFEVSVSNPITHQIYWDFEAYLMALNAALDLLARVVGVAYSDQTPVSFNKLCAKKSLVGPVDILRVAKNKWVNKFKDYRDCFVHYTPVDNRVFADIIRTENNFLLRCKLPTNPNIRTVKGFRYSKKIEVLKYASTLYRHMSALDKAVAKEIMKLYKAKEFPKRTANLFFIGQRTR
ncbi:hypothetical protein CRYPA_1029 [uncultured Candidatus Thioglobus sp.]|nr:hypothetical protein CRYPA_1029 [uncultured Candidatus Thioglobus sp.]